jgi:hypothetical protein
MVANFAARGILSVSASRGIEVDGLIHEAGMDDRLLAEPGTRLALDSVIQLWESARRRTPRNRCYANEESAERQNDSRHGIESCLRIGA